MKKLIGFTLILMIGLFTNSFAENWKLGANFNLNLTQNAYSSNWAGSEEGSISWVATGIFSAEKQMNPKIHWGNKLKLAYGQTHSSKRELNEDGEEETKWLKPEKTTDEVDFESVMRFTLQQYIDPYVSFRLESQFTDAENNMLNPMMLSEAAGIARQFIKEENQELISRLGFAFRQHIQKDVDNTNDGGIEFVTEYSHKFPEKGMSYTSTLRAFKAVFNSESDALDEAGVEWDAPTLDWEHNLSMSIVKYISVNFYLQLLYDKTKDDDMMFKETLGLGLTYKLL